MTQSISPGADAQAQEPTILGHPRGLVTLFFTEMWERFSFYGMRALLVIYLTQHFLFSDSRAQGTYGAYAALIYLMPVLGGFLADRFLGARKAITIGAVLLVFGHFGMAFEGRGTVQEVTFAGQTYDVLAQGRGASHQLFLEAPQGKIPVEFTAEGLEIGAGAGLPGFVAKADYALSQRAQGFSLGPWFIPFEQILFVSLGLIIAGVGFLKANISTTVGALYPPGDARRDVGFTIFYMGINLGSLCATLLCGWLGQTFGWWAGFGLAGFGMLLGLFQYLAGQKDLHGKAEPPRPLSSMMEGLFWTGGLLLVIPAWFLVQNTGVMISPIGDLLPLGGLPAQLAGMSLFQITVVVLFFSMFGYVGLAFKGAERSKMLVALLLIVFSVVFWTLFEQAGSSLSLFAERSTDLTIARPGGLAHWLTTGILGLISLGALGVIGWAFGAYGRKKIDLVILGYAIVFMGVLALATGFAAYSAGFGGQAYAFTAAMTQSFNPGFVVLLASPIAALWIFLGKRGWEPSTPVKFGLALLMVGLGFFVLVAGVGFADPGTFRVPLIFLILLYLFHTTGELFLSPVGLSMITKLSAAKVVGLMMGVWFLASSLAHILAAQIASTTGSETVAGQVVDASAQLELYRSVFSQVGYWGLIAGAIVLALSPLLKRGMHGVK